MAEQPYATVPVAVLVCTTCWRDKAAYLCVDGDGVIGSCCERHHANCAAYSHVPLRVVPQPEPSAQPSCNCRTHERQVCDICQGVTGTETDTEPSDEPEPMPPYCPGCSEVLTESQVAAGWRLCRECFDTLRKVWRGDLVEQPLREYVAVDPNNPAVSGFGATAEEAIRELRVAQSLAAEVEPSAQPHPPVATVVSNITGERAELWLFGEWKACSSSDTDDLFEVRDRLNELAEEWHRRRSARWFLCSRCGKPFGTDCCDDCWRDAEPQPTLTIEQVREEIAAALEWMFANTATLTDTARWLRERGR